MRVFQTTALLLLLVSACQTPPKIHGTGAVFPYGNYHHKVFVETNKNQNYNLSGILKYETDRMELVGLSNFGTTLFKIKKNSMQKNTEVKIFEKNIVQKKSSFKKFFLLVEQVMKLQKEDIKKNRTRIGSAKIEFANLNSNGTPKITKVLTDSFQLTIRTLKYERLD